MNRFAAVAEIIAKGPPPEWLVPALKSLNKAVGSDFRITPDIYRQYKRNLGHQGGRRSPLRVAECGRTASRPDGAYGTGACARLLARMSGLALVPGPYSFLVSP
jgi:hypothetical protein